MKKVTLFVALIVIFGGLTAFAFFSNMRNGKATGVQNLIPCDGSKNQNCEALNNVPPCCKVQGKQNR